MPFALPLHYVPFACLLRHTACTAHASAGSHALPFPLFPCLSFPSPYYFALPSFLPLLTLPFHLVLCLFCCVTVSSCCILAVKDTTAGCSLHSTALLKTGANDQQLMSWAISCNKGSTSELSMSIRQFHIYIHATCTHSLAVKPMYAHTHQPTQPHTLASGHSLSGIHGLHSMHYGEGSACIRGRGQLALGGGVSTHPGQGSACITGRGQLACLAMASWVALLMSGECTVAKPEASSASDLACTSCRLGMSHPLVATDCRQSNNGEQACCHYSR